MTIRAVNPTTESVVQIVTATYGLDRNDIASAYGSAQFQFSGYSAVLSLSPGVYRLDVSSADAAGTRVTQRRAVTVVESHPLTSIDVPVNGSTVATTFAIGGWAIDTGAPEGTGVDAIHVWAFKNSDPNQAQFVGVPTLGVSRPDVGAVYGSRFTPSGYNLLATLSPGSYQLNVYTHSSVTNSFSLVTVIWITVQ